MTALQHNRRFGRDMPLLTHRQRSEDPHLTFEANDTTTKCTVQLF
jgi:hypothetical protein